MPDQAAHRPNRVSWLSLWVLAILIPVAGSIGTPTTLAAERNILFIITDDESPTLGCYGDPCAVTPAIDQVAKDGMIFRNAMATTASCSASRSVVMSGLHNHRNGQYGHQHHFHKFSSFDNVGKISLPRVLADSGYRTGHIGKYHVAPESAYHFETYLRGNGRNAVSMAESAKSFMTDSSDPRPFFLYFATADPHRNGKTDDSSPLALKPDLFGNLPDRKAHAGVKEIFFDPAKVLIPPFLPDTPETREELAHYYQSCARIDAGVGRLVEILKAADLYDKTLLVFTSDHGMAFAGGKTTVYEGGLRVPMVVRDPYQSRRGVQSDALISHADITPTLIDYAGALNSETNSPKKMAKVASNKPQQQYAPRENRNGRKAFRSYHGRSWLHCLSAPDEPHHRLLFASHTFHEIQMYYPMRVVRDQKYKLIWNIAHPLPYPFASDLWVASSWQAQLAKGMNASYGKTTVGGYLQRPEFELYDIEADPYESNNLALSSGHADILEAYQAKLKQVQETYEDPWVSKWDYE